MILASELKEISIFSEFSNEDLEKFSRAAADMRLEAGQVFVHEGDPCGFYLVLSGEVRGRKNLHGIELEIELLQFKTGEFFGELSALFDMPAGMSMYAAGACRLARFELPQLQELVREGSPASEPILRTMMERVAAGQRYVQTAPINRVTFRGCEGSQCVQKASAFLAANRITYESQVVEREDHHDLEAFTVTIDGKQELVNPTLRVLAEAIGLQTAPKRSLYDVVIVGAGPAGMAASVYGASEGLRVLMVERGAAGGQAGTSSRIENYLGFPGGISGRELAQRALKQGLRFGAEIAIARSVTEIVPCGRNYTVVLDEGERVETRCVLLATGVDWRRLQAPGVEDYLGRGVLYGASRTEAMSVAGKQVFVVGGGNSAGQAAMFFADYAANVTLLVRGGGLSATMSQYLIEQLVSKENIRIQTDSEVTGVRGAEALEEIHVCLSPPGATRMERVYPADALFIMIGATANTGWLPSGLQRDQKGFICTGHSLRPSRDLRPPLPLETSFPGIFCAGDVRSGSIKRVASSVGEGSMAISFIHEYLAG